MAIVTTDDKYYKSIADTLRRKLGGSGQYYPSTMASNIESVYTAGENAERTAFWDTYQQYGERRNYRCAFYGPSWTAEIFKPKYDIVPTDAWNMFNGSGVEDLTDGSVTLDFSQCTKGAMSCFQGCTSLKYVGVIDLSMCNDIRQFFSGCTALEAVSWFRFPPASVCKGNTTNIFQNCKSLEEIYVDSSIEYNVDFGACKELTAESLYSICNALNNDITGKTLTIATEAAARLPENVWDDIGSQKSNWTIATV